VAPVFSWTGFYVGGQLGYAWGKDNGTVYSTETGLDTTTGVFDSFSSTQSHLSPSGAIGGAHIGYNWQINQFVLGVEANVDATNYHAQQNIFSVASFPGGSSDIGLFNNQIRSTIQGAFRGRVGWAWNNWLFYGTGGVAFTDATTQYRTGAFIPSVPFSLTSLWHPYP
jgi:outer membrane immunogenic protein